MPSLVAVALATGSISACSNGEASERRTVVASIYPLAFAAERVAGPGWEVIDLTPPGVEAHDVELSLEDRAAIEEADLVVYLGDIGFQPQVEAAVEEARGEVLDVGDSVAVPARQDPHVWLFPPHMDRIGQAIASRIAGSSLDAYRADIRDLTGRYESALGDGCRHETIIVPHEAFGYLAESFGFRQFGLAGLAPEGEPTSGRLAEAQRLIESGEAGAVFFEPTDEASQRTAETLARDTGVPALPLSTLESQPPDGDYISVMEDNLESVREGLGCP